MDYYIGLCPAPCLLEDDKTREHERHISHARGFLKGDVADLFARIE